MISTIITYYCISSLIMTVKIHLDGDGFFAKQLQIARKKRNELNQKLSNRQISPIMHKRELERNSDKATIRTTLLINYLLSPVIAPVIFLSFLLSLISEIIITVRNI